MTVRASRSTPTLMALAIEQLHADTTSIQDRWDSLSSAEQADQLRTYQRVRHTLPGRLHPSSAF